MDRRVVVTGLGIHSVLGSDIGSFWNHLTDGQSGITNIDIINTSNYSNKRGGQIKGGNIEQYVTDSERKSFGKCSQWAIATSRLAVEDSGLDINDANRDKIGVAFGTTEGEVESLQKIDDCLYGHQAADKHNLNYWMKTYPCSMIPAAVATALKIHGDCVIDSNACSAANYAVGYSYDLIKSGRVDVMIAGGADVFSRVAFTGFNRLLAVAPDEVRPFDSKRQGMMVAEGSASIVLENLESAQKRNAHIYAEVLGYGISNDAYHITTPHPKAEGVISAMKKAIDHSGISAKDIQYVSLHGTGTTANDNDEMVALDKLFGEMAKDVMASSIKGALGHAMGAASAIEMVACALLLDTDIIPPTINVRTVDSKCTFDLVVGKSRKKNVSVIMNNAYAFGGCNSCVILKSMGKEGMI